MKSKFILYVPVCVTVYVIIHVPKRERKKKSPPAKLFFIFIQYLRILVVEQMGMAYIDGWYGLDVPINGMTFVK